jgi:uncharacterized repeat protein (TIGR01451 family)
MFSTKIDYLDINKLVSRLLYVLTGTGLIVSTISSFPLTAIAQVAAPGTIIENQVTGSFSISGDANNTLIPAESNIVSVTVAEVAGIAIVGTSITEAPSNVAGGGVAQGLGGINPGDIVYFDFALTNTGNDPTQFTISPSNTIVTGGTLLANNNIQIIGYNPTGIGNDTLLTTPISVSGTVDSGGTGGIGLPNGSVPVGGSIKVRVPIRVNSSASSGDRLAVQLTATTKDNPNYTATNNVPVNEATGIPDSEKTGSAIQAVFVVSSSLVVGYESVRVTTNRPNAVPGDRAIWTISYINASSADIANFQITDLLPTQVTKFNAPTVSIGGSQILLPSIDSNYNGTTNLNLFNNSSTPFTLKAGGTVTVNISTTVNAGVSTTISNQAQATGTGLATVLTDDVGIPSDLPLLLTSPPYNLSIPANSVPQTQQTTIDYTILPISTAAKLLFVKRITKICNLSLPGCSANPNNNPNDNTVLNSLVYNSNPANLGEDLNPGWPSNYLYGAINGGIVKSQDEIEHTVYFINAGNKNARQVRICEPIPINQIFQQASYGTNLGIRVVLGNNTTSDLTNSADTTDRGQFIANSSNVPANCNLSTVNTSKGVIVIDLTGATGTGTPNLVILPNSTNQAQPATSYGYFRYRTKVD